MKKPEIVEVQQRDVACDGKGGPLGHPRVFLHLDDEAGQIVCPYCSRVFLLEQAGRTAA